MRAGNKVIQPIRESILELERVCSHGGWGRGAHSSGVPLGKREQLVRIREHLWKHAGSGFASKQLDKQHACKTKRTRVTTLAQFATIDTVCLCVCMCACVSVCA